MSLPRSGLALALAALLCAPSLSASPAARDRVLTGTLESAAASATAGPEGALVELAGGTRLRVSPGARIVHERSIKLKLGPRGDDDRLTRVIRVLRGSVDTELPAAGAPPAVMFHGPSRLSAVVKEGAGTFLVNADSTTAASRRGEALVGLGNDWNPLREGLARTLSARDPAATPRSILSAPTPALETELLLASGDALPKGVVRWSPLAGAVTHRLRVERTSPPAAVLIDGEVEAATATTPALTPGTYAVSVAAADATGLAGPSSTALPLQVVGLALPAG
ncbi:MAG: hypothetical protein FJ104_04835, partial [Deltaproteobacteria bacterium]|nr:hypothetical protein [Deltaproteobacteria bacterium]